MNTLNFEFEFEFASATIICTCLHFFACASSEYEIRIIANNREQKSILTHIGIFESEYEVCANLYEKWLNKEI